MKVIALMFCCMCLWMANLTAHADGNCPPGYYEVGGGGASGCIAYPNASGSIPDPGPAWSTRWGAIATADGVFGVAHHASTAKKAERLAMKQCKAKGGKNCRVNLSFANQCAALAWGSGFNIAKPAGDREQAESSALAQCRAKANSCEVFYSGCNYPERIH
jgi:hypothetical protein